MLAKSARTGDRPGVESRENGRIKGDDERVSSRGDGSPRQNLIEDRAEGEKRGYVESAPEKGYRTP